MNKIFLKHLNNFYSTLQFFVKVLATLNKFYDEQSNIESVEKDLLKEFFNRYCEEIESFSELLIYTYEQTNIKNLPRKLNKQFCQIIAYVYIKVIKFPNKQFFISSIVGNNFFSNIINLIDGKIHLHHLHVTCEIHGY